MLGCGGPAGAVYEGVGGDGQGFFFFLIRGRSGSGFEYNGVWRDMGDVTAVNVYFCGEGGEVVWTVGDA